MNTENEVGTFLYEFKEKMRIWDVLFVTTEAKIFNPS